MRRMIWMFAVLLSAVMLAGCVSAVPEPAKELSGDGWSGRVVDGSTGQPLPGALVWIRWSTFSPGHSHAETCQHMDVTVTDAEGRFRTPPWRVENPPFAYGRLSRITEVYLRGYGRTREDRGMQSNPDLLMPPWVGTDDERLDFLMGLRMQGRCMGVADRGADAFAVKIYRALLSEFVQIPGGRERKYLGFSDVSMWEEIIRELEGIKK